MSRHGPFPIVHSSAGRNPWSGGGGESVSSSVSDDQTYHVIPHQYAQVEKYWGPPPAPPPPPLLTHLLPPPHQQNRLPQGSRATSSRAVTPQSSPTEAVILPCGGHCVLFETFCHKFLQVALVGGVLSGGILLGAGMLGGPDTGVLAYIGSLTALVCGLLLAVQARSRRPQRTRRRSPVREDIPLRDIQSQPVFREESGIPWWRRENID